MKNNAFVSIMYMLLICPDIARGAWWYSGCFHSNLNGDYQQNETWLAVSWRGFRGDYYSLMRTEMKLRRI